jgi:hypothetical protein
MKALIRFTVATLLALPAVPRVASAQPAPAPAPAPDATGQPAPTTEPPPPPAEPVSPPVAPPPVAAPPAAAPATPPTVPKGPEWSSLRLLHSKGLISDAELASALKDIGVLGAADATTLVLSRFKTTLYGYAEGNFVYDTTQSCVEFCANSQIQKPHTYRGEHGRTIFGPRDARFGIRIAAPEEHGIRGSALIETDFFGPTTTTEQGTYSNPVMRIRNAYLRLETPVVDLLIGQTWSLFGWQPVFLLASVQPPGLPGQMFERTTQFKVSKTIKSPSVVTDIAIAANRPPQQDSATPEGVAGIRLSFPTWTGQHTAYMASTTINPASIAITGDLRKFRIPEFAVAQHTGHVKVGGGVSFGLYLPLVKATKDSKDNALSLIGEFTIGTGTSDMYTALGAAGTANASLPPATMGGAAVPYTANFDPGLAAVDVTGHIELIKWTSYIVGAEFYPGGTGNRLGLFANFGHQESSNAKSVGTASPAAGMAATAAAARIRDHEEVYEGGLFFDPTKATRIAASGAVYNDTYGDHIQAQNVSVMMSGWLFF